MKKFFFTSFTFILLIGTSCQKKIDIEAEKKVIMDVLEEESNGVSNLDYTRLSETWLQNENATFVSSGRSSYGYMDGFEEIGTWMKDFIENPSEPFVSKLEKTNFKISVYDDKCAWATYDETWHNAKGEITASLLVTKIFENIDGAWKIVYTAAINKSSYEEENEANEPGSEAEETE